MGWIFEGIEKDDKKREYSDRELIKRSLKRFYPFKKQIIISSSTVVIVTITSLLGPIIFANLIDRLQKPQNTDIYLIIIFASGFIFMVLSILNWFADYIINIQVANLSDFMVTLRGDIFDAFQKQDMKFFDHHRSGELNSRVSSDASDYGSAVFIVMTVFGDILIIILVFIVLALINLPLALISASVVPILFIASFLFRKIARTTSMNFRRVHAEVNAAIAESVDGINVLKTFGVGTESLEEFEEINNRHFRSGLRRNMSMNLFFPFVNILAIGGTVLILFFGGQAAIQNLGLISAGTLYLFINLLGRFFFPITQIVNFYAQIQAGFAAYERILQIIDEEPEVKDEGTIEPDKIEGIIEFKNVDFEYVTGKPVLTNFSLTIHPGEKLAIVGRTGAGKTSIISILSRFYEFQNGEILIDDIPIRNIKLKAYRKHLGLVLQSPFLFNGNILENITYGRKDASKEDLQRALEISRVNEIVEYLKDGLETQVGERGSLLSTGQRQLVSFARALLADPKILILDEATSSVDAYTESMIQESLEELMKGRTSIIIAHRLSTIKSADRIIVLDKGKTIEQGSHENLLAQGGEYASLYNMYFKHQEITWIPTEVSEPVPVESITPP